VHEAPSRADSGHKRCHNPPLALPIADETEPWLSVHENCAERDESRCVHSRPRVKWNSS